MKMNCKERVGLAIQHKKVDKVPKGELEIERSLSLNNSFWSGQCLLG